MERDETVTESVPGEAKPNEEPPKKSPRIDWRAIAKCVNKAFTSFAWTRDVFLGSLMLCLVWAIYTEYNTLAERTPAAMQSTFENIGVCHIQVAMLQSMLVRVSGFFCMCTGLIGSALLIEGLLNMIFICLGIDRDRKLKRD